MAKRKRADEPAPQSFDSPGDSSPSVPKPLHVSRVELKANVVLHRVHPEKYAATEFNPGPHGNARFSPIYDASGKSIPTIYAGETFECAAMETVFHDVPYGPGPKIYAKSKLKAHLHSVVGLAQPLLLADLGTKSLRKMGLERKDVIDTEKDSYPFTRQVAEAIHAQDAEVHGLQWTSRQDDSAFAFMLFGDRVPTSTLAQIGQSRNLTEDPQAYDEVLDLATKIGVDVVAAQ